jgi:aminoglycoside phosphotransferase (APT) family kinase protein
MENISTKVLLSNILNSLKNDVQPGVASDRASMSLETIIKLLSRMIANCPETEGQLSLDTPIIHLLRNDRIADALSRKKAITALPELLQLARSEGDVLADVEQKAEFISQAREYDESGISASLSPDQVEQQRVKLESYLREHYDNKALEVVDFRYVVGGRTKQTVFLDVSGDKHFSKTVVLRMDGAVNLSGGKSVTYEYPLQQKLADLGMKVPRPILLEQDERILGQPFMIVQLMPGKMAGSFFLPPAIDSVLASHAAELAMLHNAPADLFSDVPDINTAPVKADLLRELDELENVIATSDCPSSFILDAAFAWLRKNVDLAFLGAPCLAHRDAVFHNVLMEDNKVSAVLDWELARISYAAEDLGYIRSAITQVMPWQDYITHYAAAGGPEVDPRQIDFYAVLSVLRNCSMASNVRHLIATGATNDIELTTVSLYDFYRMRYQVWQHLERAVSSV